MRPDSCMMSVMVPRIDSVETGGYLACATFPVCAPWKTGVPRPLRWTFIRFPIHHTYSIPSLIATSEALNLREFHESLLLPLPVDEGVYLFRLDLVELLDGICDVLLCCLAVYYEDELVLVLNSCRRCAQSLSGT